MPKRTGSSPVSGKIASGFKKAAAKPTDYGTDFSDPPAGISQGIAQLIDAHVGTFKTGDNAGERFFYVAGTIVEPVQVVST